jgi:hypothetical protein
LGQEEDGATWTVNLNVNNEKDLSISYPGVETIAKWEHIFNKRDQIVFLEYASFGEDHDKQVFTVLINRISDDILHIKYYEFDPSNINAYNMFSQDKLLATAMIKRRIGPGNSCKVVGTPKNFEFIPQPIKWKKVAKYK